MKHILSIIGLSLLGSALAFGQGGVGGKGGFGGKGGVGGGMTVVGVTWTTVSAAAAANHNFTCTSTACATGTVTSTTAGNLEIVLWAAFGANASAPPLTSNAVTGDSSFTECPNFPKQFNYNGASDSYELVDCFYKLSATGGATSFTVTPTWNGGTGVNGQAQDVQFIEAHRSTATAIYDNSAVGAGTNTCTSNLCPSPALTISGTSDYCVQVIATASNPPTAISGSYTGSFDSSNVFGGFGWNNAVTSYSIVNWSVTSSPPDGATPGVVCFK